MSIKKSRVFKPELIDIANWRHIRNYAVSMRVTEEALKEAIRAVGPVADDVRNHLGGHHNPIMHRPGKGLHF